MLSDAPPLFEGIEPDTAIVTGDIGEVPFPIDPSSSQVQVVILDCGINAPGVEPHAPITKRLKVDTGGKAVTVEVLLRATKEGRRKVMSDGRRLLAGDTAGQYIADH